MNNGLGKYNIGFCLRDLPQTGIMDVRENKERLKERERENRDLASRVTVSNLVYNL